MLNRNKLVFILLAFILTVAMVIPAVAAQDETINVKQSRQIAVDRAWNSRSTTASMGVLNGEGHARPFPPPMAGLPSPAYAPCVTFDNTCDAWPVYYVFNMPSGGGSGTRTMAATQVINPNLTPESLTTVYVYVEWDPANESAPYYGYAATAGTPSLRVEIEGDAAGSPDGALVNAASVTRVFADWSTDAALTPILGGAWVGGYLAFDLSSFGIVLSAGATVHIVVHIDQTTPGVDWLWMASDAGPDEVLCTVYPDLSDEYRTSIPGWQPMNVYGGNYNWSIAWDLCTQQPPAVCDTLHNWCDGATSVTIFGMPRLNRYAFANRYFAGQVGTAQPCTVKTVFPWFYDSDGPATTGDVEIKIYADAAGLPGAILWIDTVLYASLTLDLSGPTTIPVPDVVVTGDFYVGYSIVNEVPAATINVFTFVGSPLGGGDPGCASYNPNACFVQALPSMAWTDDIGFFGGESEMWVDVALCCPQLPYATCFPTTEDDWATRSNNFQRTNATGAMIADLCGITRVWSADVDPVPGAAPVIGINFTSPVIADGKVLISTFNSLNCYDQVTGALLWTFAGFPWVGDDLRCNVTVEGDSAVYVGGASFRAFSKIRLSNGSVIWSRNAGGVDVPLGTGFTRFAPSVVDAGAVVTIDEAGAVWKLDPVTGADLAPPILLPDAPNAIPLDALTGDGAGKIWVGTANSGTLTDGNIFQIDIAAWTIDWQLEDPSFKFFADTDYEPEGFAAPLAYEDGVLYYHSRIRDDAGGNPEYPDKVGAIGKIDVTIENGTGNGIMWVAPPPAGGVLYAGVTVGPGYIYTGHQGVWVSATEPHGVGAYDKALGLPVWNYAFGGVITEGTNVSGTVVNNLRVRLPITLICGMDGVPYLFVGDDGGGGGSLASGGDWHLLNGNTGEELWRRKFSGAVSGTAVVDGFLAVATANHATGVLNSGGSLVGFIVDAGRPRLQIDTEQVFRTATPGDGLSPINALTDAISNTGCVDLNIASYTVVGAAPLGPGPTRAIVTGTNPALSAAAERTAKALATGGYEMMLQGLSDKQIATLKADAQIYEPEVETNVRAFAENVRAAVDPIFLTFNSGPASIPAGGTGTLNVQYDETGLLNNTLYINYILIDSDDPDFYPQDPAGAIYGDPYVQFNLFIGCPDASAYMTMGLGEDWVANFGALANGDGDGMHVNGHDYHFDGGMALATKDSTGGWALDGISVTSTRAKEWGPTLPCGVNIGVGNYGNPLGGMDACDTVSYNMIDLADPAALYFPTGTRQCGGLFLTVQRVTSHDAAFGDISWTKVVLTNEVDGKGTVTNMYFGVGTDWDIAPASGSNNTNLYADGGYACDNGGAGGKAAASAFVGHVRLDANAIGTCALGSGGSPNFGMDYFFADDDAYQILSNPLGYLAIYHPGDVIQNTDVGVYMSIQNQPSLAEGESMTIYYAQFQVDDGVNGRTWVDAAGFDAARTDIVCKAKAFAGFGKGDLNCDGCNDLADVVLLGNIVDGVVAASGAAIYTSDVDGDLDIDNADYDLLYDVVAGVQPASALANAWRF